MRILIAFADRAGLRGVSEIERLNHAVERALKMELDRTHTAIKGDFTVYHVLNVEKTALRYCIPFSTTTFFHQLF